jgi:uncharacterized protein involved in cysteine biosynthesis
MGASRMGFSFFLSRRQGRFDAGLFDDGVAAVVEPSNQPVRHGSVPGWIRSCYRFPGAELRSIGSHCLTHLFFFRVSLIPAG